MTGRFLIVNADDFGLSREVNDAVIDCHLNGVVTAASAMTNLDAFPHAVELARNCPKLDVGVHLNLTHGHPLNAARDVPTLVCGDAFAPLSVFARRVLRRSIDIGEVEREWSRQIERARDTGLGVSHLDGHLHLHALPALFPVAVSLARRFRIPWLRLPIERPDRPASVAAGAIPRLGKLMVVSAVSLLQAKPLTNSGLKRADTFWGGNLSSALTEAGLLRALKRFPTGVTEVMCHPGPGIGTSRAMQRRSRCAGDEIAALKAASVRAVVESRFTLTSFRELASDAAARSAVGHGCAPVAMPATMG